MSGEGLIASAPPAQLLEEIAQRFRQAERADVLAYLGRRAANAATIEAAKDDMDEFASDRRRQLEVIIGDISAGLHDGSAEVERSIAGQETE